MLWLLRLITGHEAWIWFEQSESFTQIQFQAEALIGFHPLDLTLAFQNDNPCKTHLRVRFTSILHKYAFEGSRAQAAPAKILFLHYSKQLYFETIDWWALPDHAENSYSWLITVLDEIEKHILVIWIAFFLILYQGNILG